MVGLDWIVLVLYISVVLMIGLRAGKTIGGENENFLAGRTIPTWAATLSVAATVQSAATFIGGPEMVYRNDLRHLLRFSGSITAAFIVAYFIFPLLYRTGKITVYGFLEERFGRVVQITASSVFLVGISLSAGARLFIAAVAFALVLFGELHLGAIITAIVLVGTVGTIYTALGGMRAVVWTDVLQSITYITAAVTSVVVLLILIPVSWEEAMHILKASGPEGGSKLRLFDWRFDIRSDDTFWASLIGLCAFHVAFFSTQQDLAQRLLACRSAKAASASLLRGIFVIFGFSLVFALIGVLLFVFYQSSGMTTEDTRKVYPEFILKHIPMGLRGLIIAGVFAAAMSSMDSAVNSMAATITCDIFRRSRREGGFRTVKNSNQLAGARNYRRSICGLGCFLIGAAILLAVIQSKDNRELFDFAVMAAFYGISGLLGVFLAGLFTRRGNTVSAIFALFAGGGAVGFCALLPDISSWWSDRPWELGFPWWIVVGIATSFLVCLSGKRKTHGASG